MAYLKKKMIDEAIRQKPRKKDVYKTDLVKTNEKLQVKAASDATLQAVKTGLDPIVYLTILKNLCFSNQSEQHPIRSLFLATRQLYKKIQYASENTTD